MRKPEGTLTLGVMAVVWFLGSALLANAAAFLILYGQYRVYGRGSGLREFMLIAAPATQLCLLFACLRRGMRVGDGNLRVGLAWLRTRRRLDVALLSGLAAMTAIGHLVLAAKVPAYRAFFEQVNMSLPSLLDDRDMATGTYVAWVVLVLVVGAPLSEELFFRGWLWVGLERWWGSWVAAAVTGPLWLVVHVFDGGFRRVLALVPAMVIICLARAVGGSVRASIAVHVANNAVLSAVLIASRLAPG
jgi:membrane protease YdiL (CAAX protease family)